MTTTDWLIDLLLVLVVFRQLRETHIGLHFVALPLAAVTFVGHQYLHGLPTAGNDLVLIGVLVAIGAALGIAGGIFTRVRFDGRRAFVRAGVISVVLWVVGVGARMGFQIWSDHGGAPSIAHFSVVHEITSGQAWATAFVLMALTEVGTRMGTILLRAWAASRRPESRRPEAVDVTPVPA